MPSISYTVPTALTVSGLLTASNGAICSSVLSVAGQNLVLGVGTGGAAITVTTSTLAVALAGPLTVAQTITSTGLINAYSGISINTGGTFGAGRIYKSSASGLTIVGVAGATYDFAFYDPTGNYTLLANPTGTANLVVGGTLSVSSTTSSTSASTGALVVSGGIGVAGQITSGGGAMITGAPNLPTAWTGGYGIGFDGALINRRIFFGDGSGCDLRFSTRAASATTDCLILADSGNITMYAGATLQIGATYAAGAPTATGYLTIKDSTGTSYKIPAVAA